jgi:hypothetical protein
MFKWDEQGMVAEENSFIKSLVGVEGDVAVQREDASARTISVNSGAASPTAGSEYLNGTLANASGNRRPVRELSRLWKYRNGMSPIELDE